MKKKVFWVDVPDPDNIYDYEGTWINVGSFDTREDAVKFIQENIDPDSKNGTINLITEGEELE